MLFPTIQFAAFFILVLIVSWALHGSARWWKRFMLAASYVFYAGWDWRFVGLIVASTVINQVLAFRICRAKQRGHASLAKALMVFAAVANLGVLGWFKYYEFFSLQLDNFLARFGLGSPIPLLHVLLPVGISFFTFHALSYVIDVYRGTIEPAQLIDFAVYMAFFPHLVAGPIVRASELVPQLRKRARWRGIDFSRAIMLILAGLFKKVVVSSYLANGIVDRVFANPKQHSALEVLFAVYGYAIQIYADFSGYTDIAIGCALLLGFQFPQNFDSPYSAVSLQDFWRRWHMTLSRWLRDYLYISLGGNRRGKARTYLNLFVTMVLGGLWHGAAWKFVVWGSLHGGGQAFGTWRRERRDASISERSAREPAVAPSRPWRSSSGGLAVADRVEVKPVLVATAARPRNVWLARLATFHFVCLGWVFFRASSVDNAIDLLGRLVHWGAAPLVTPLLVFTIVAMLASQLVPATFMTRVCIAYSQLHIAAQALVLAGGVLLIDVMGPTGIAPFIYFQF